MQSAASVAVVSSKKAVEFSIHSLMEKTEVAPAPSTPSLPSPMMPTPPVGAMSGLHAANQFLLNLAALSSLQEAFMDNLRQGGVVMPASPTHPAFAGALPSSLPGFMTGAYSVEPSPFTAAVGAMRRSHLLSPPERRSLGHGMTSPYKRQQHNSIRGIPSGEYSFVLFVLFHYMREILYRVVQKMAQLLISHKIHSGLCSLTKLQGRQFQPVFSQSLNLN